MVIMILILMMMMMMILWFHQLLVTVLPLQPRLHNPHSPKQTSSPHPFKCHCASSVNHSAHATPVLVTQAHSMSLGSSHRVKCL
eukprot:6458618-Amphidinium_carterae.1